MRCFKKCKRRLPGEAARPGTGFGDAERIFLSESVYRTRPSILLVDEDADQSLALAEFLDGHGFASESAHDGGRGLARALAGNFDLVILDVTLPVLDGFEVLRQLRRRSAIPVIMLAERMRQQDRIAGLDAGADDYLSKPVALEELLARIRAVLRRAVRAAVYPSPGAAIGDLRLDDLTRQAWAGSDEVSLTTAEFDILDLLARSAGRIVSRDELTTALYQRPATPYERSLDVHICHLRKKIEPAGVAIRNSRGVGYLLHPAPR
jgi:two-component system, OmpR family, response regulator CpxR